jgi:6-phosphofructokinase 1
VVEVLGEQAGWLALQAGIAVGADAVLIPEIPCDLKALASRLKDKVTARRPWGLVVVAEGAKLVEDPQSQAKPPSLKASLSPLATGEASEHVIRRSGLAAETVANRLQLLIAQETFPLVLGPWVRTGSPTAVDRQLGMAYGAGAVRALKAGKNGVMVAFVPPDIKFVPLVEAINKVRTVPADSEFMQIASSLGIFLGREL